MSSDTHTGTATDLDTITHSEDIENPPHKGEVIFTGPDGVGDHRVTVMDSHQYVGGVTASPEATGDVKYMCRAPKASVESLGEYKGLCYGLCKQNGIINYVRGSHTACMLRNVLSLLILHILITP